jgi:ribonuclease HI
MVTKHHRWYQKKKKKTISNCIRQRLTIIEGEVMTLLEALHEVISWSTIVFESHSKVIVDAIHANQSGMSKFSSIIFSIEL